MWPAGYLFDCAKAPRTHTPFSVELTDRNTGRFNQMIAHSMKDTLQRIFHTKSMVVAVRTVRVTV